MELKPKTKLKKELKKYRFLPFYVKNLENKPSKGSFAAGLVFLLNHFLTKPAASAVFCLKSQEYMYY